MLKRELKINRNSLLLWTGILVFLFLIVFLVYPSIVDNNASFNEMLKSFPEEMLKSFNMDISSIDTSYGWFKTEGYSIILIIEGLYCAILGSTILLKEENDKTIEFLYSKPISKKDILNSKILCGIINIFLMTFIITIINLTGFYLNGDLEIKEFLMISFCPLLSNISIFFICILSSIFFKKTKKSMGFGICLVFLSYFLQIIGNLDKSLKTFKCFSILELSSIRKIIINGNINIICLIISIVLIIVAYLISKTIYNRKELV